LFGDPLIVAGSARDNVEPVKRFPKPLEGEEVGCESFFFHVAGFSIPCSVILGGEGFSDELDPLLSPRISWEVKEGDSTGVLGRQPG